MGEEKIKLDKGKRKYRVRTTKVDGEITVKTVAMKKEEKEWNEKV